MNPYILGTTNYQDVRFPGDLRDCRTSHMTGIYRVENVGVKAAGSQPRRLHQDDTSDLCGVPGMP